MTTKDKKVLQQNTKSRICNEDSQIIDSNKIENDKVMLQVPAKNGAGEA